MARAPKTYEQKCVGLMITGKISKYEIVDLLTGVLELRGNHMYEWNGWGANTDTTAKLTRPERIQEREFL